MDGMEKITAKILADAQAEVADINAEAQEKARQIRQQYEVQAQQEAQDILQRGKKAADERLARLQSAAGLERRKMELAAKQQVLSEAFELALDKLSDLPEQEYVALLAALAVRAARTGQEQLIFSPKDRARVGKQVVMAANEALVRKAAPAIPESLGESKFAAILGKVVQSTAAMVTGTGMLTISEQTRPIRAGFIMCDGDIETNCAFETLVAMHREKLEREVADVLFN